VGIGEVRERVVLVGEEGQEERGAGGERGRRREGQEAREEVG
jgi:hypothetical protein